MSRLALGTVQFGLDYGVSNQTGKVDLDEAKAILTACEELGIRSLDTATEYGDSEKILGEIGIPNFSITTKLPNLRAKEEDNINQIVTNCVKRSLFNLKRQNLDAILVHNPQNLFGPKGQIIWRSLKDLQIQFNISKIGVSIYDPSELNLLENRNIYPEIVQAPYNIFDQKIYRSGWLQKLVDRDVEIHARSVFLQGLLLQDESCRDRYFSRWSEQFNQFKDFLEETGYTALEACLQFVLANPLFKKIVVGVQSVQQLIDIAMISPLSDNGIKAKYLACDDLDLIRPQNWQLQKRN